MEEKECGWCHSDNEGNYNCNRFQNDSTGDTLSIFFCGGMATISLGRNGQAIGMMSAKINYCPMCGRLVRKKAEETEGSEG